MHFLHSGYPLEGCRGLELFHMHVLPCWYLLGGWFFHVHDMPRGNLLGGCRRLEFFHVHVLPPKIQLAGWVFKLRGAFREKRRGHGSGSCSSLFGGER